MKGLPRSRKAGGKETPILSQTIPIKDKTLSVTNGAPGYGNVAIAALPEGNILFLGAVSYFEFSTSDADVIATFDGDYSVGTAGTSNGDLSGTNEANIISSAAFGAATAKVSPVVRGISPSASCGVVIDNTQNDVVFYLNVLIDDASISGNADFTVNGNLIVSYTMLGDD